VYRALELAAERAAERAAEAAAEEVFLRGQDGSAACEDGGVCVQDASSGLSADGVRLILSWFAHTVADGLGHFGEGKNNLQDLQICNHNST